MFQDRDVAYTEPQAKSPHMVYTATIQFHATNAELAKETFELMREAFANEPRLLEIRASLIDALFNQHTMVGC